MSLFDLFSNKKINYEKDIFITYDFQTYTDLAYMKFMLPTFFIIDYHFWLNKTEGLGTLATHGNTAGHKTVKLSRKVLKDNCDI